MALIFQARRHLEAFIPAIRGGDLSTGGNLSLSSARLSLRALMPAGRLESAELCIHGSFVGLCFIRQPM
jgi:hypothetical protein